ncbi:MAG: hypothetical protein BRD29_01325 [Bacteroidetes bacterium QH_2_67_10]|nr:MAG: hypothetical protein BRD29_01325 [Bacteroidetes bacterium QH_2_67_10]
MSTPSTASGQRARREATRGHTETSSAEGEEAPAREGSGGDDSEKEKGRVTRRVKRVRQGRTGRWLERLTRFGYFTRATVFTLVGLVAMRAAWGIGQATGTRGVMREMRRQPFGKTLLLATSIGMACYVLWRFVQVVLDPFTKGDGAQSSIRRIGYFGSGSFYALLSVTAAQLAFNFAGGRSFRREVVVWALAMPYGSWVVGFAGVALFFVGSHALWRAYRASYMQLYPPPTPETARRQRFARLFGRVGLISMGLTLWIVGALIIMAAVYANPDQAIGIGGALTVLQRGPYGALLLVAAGVGFVFYGGHTFFLGFYRRVRPED